MKATEHKFEVTVTTEQPEEQLAVLQYFASILNSVVQLEKDVHLSEPLKSVVIDLRKQKERRAYKQRNNRPDADK